MAAQDFLALVNGVPSVKSSVQVGGAGNANQIPSLNGSGVFDASMMPAGLGIDTIVVPTSENLAAGAFVNLYSNAGTLTGRNADASTTGKEAVGFVLAATTSPASATVYMRGSNTAVTGLTVGTQYWLSTTTPGGTQVAAASYTAGQMCQYLGRATSATAIDFTFSGFINT